jgi:hypothetical protein
MPQITGPNKIKDIPAAPATTALTILYVYKVYLGKVRVEDRFVCGNLELLLMQ